MMIWKLSYFRKAPMKPTISVHVEHKPPVMAKYHQVPPSVANRFPCRLGESRRSILTDGGCIKSQSHGGYVANVAWLMVMCW